jgi:predicted O-methyltransferase YrrM
MSLRRTARALIRELRSTRVKFEHAEDERDNYPQMVAVASANSQTVQFLRTTESRTIAEIGIYEGHTSREIARMLDGRGELHLYDFDDVVARVAAELSDLGYRNIKTFPNSYKYLDSYNWSLGKVLAKNPEPIYDYVFIDGAHTWAIDGFASLLADRLLKPGGHLDFDDHNWTLADSRALRPQNFPLTARMYTPEQIRTQQVQMICDLLFRRDDRYTEVVPDKIFRKERI